MTVKKKVYNRPQLVPKPPVPVQPPHPYSPQQEPDHTPTKEELHMTRIAVASNGTIRYLAQVLMNGARFSADPMTNFNVHSGLTNKMRQSLEDYQRAFRTHPENEAEQQARADAMTGAEEQFFSLVQTYLEQAVGHLHGSGSKEDIPEVLLHLKLLVHEHEDMGGFEEVARYLVVSAHAPMDRF